MNGSVVVVGQVPAPVSSRSGNVFVECNAQEENTLCYPMTTGCREEVRCVWEVRKRDQASETVAKQEIQVSALSMILSKSSSLRKISFKI